MRKEAFQKLSRRFYHSHELTRDLLKNGHPKAEVEALIESLIKDGYLADTEWEDSFFRTALNKGWSPLEVRAKLNNRGITSSSLLERLKCEEANLIQTLLRKKYKNKTPDKIRQALYRKGFSSAAISGVL